jgi:transketolase
MQITKTNARIWSRLGPRAVYGQALLALASEDDRIIALSADLGNSSGLDRFKATFPDRFVNAGIAEQNLIGVAAGIAKEGFTVFASSFAPFITMRACEQVRMNMGYMELNVKAVAIGSGLAMGFLGNSHFGLEDLAVINAIPNITIISPADCSEVVKTVYAAADYPGPVYIRLTGTPGMPSIYEENYLFKIGETITLLDGGDLAIIAHGSMVIEALNAAKILEGQGIHPEVVNMHTMRPIDRKSLTRLFLRHDLIVVVEEHFSNGGLGSVLSQFAAEQCYQGIILSIAIENTFQKTEDYEKMLSSNRLKAPDIATRIAEQLKISHLRG